MDIGLNAPPLGRGEGVSAVDGDPGRWLPTCGTCGERGDVDEIDLIIGHVTIVCTSCGLAWTEVFAGGMRASIGTSAVRRDADFAHYEHLPRPERASVMVRVLCGLVALEDEVPVPN